MLYNLSIALRILLLGCVPLVFLLAVLAASWWAAKEKDVLFNRLYDNHLVILGDLLQVQRLLQNQLGEDVRKYRSGWMSAEALHEGVTRQLQQAEQQWQQFVAQRPAVNSDADNAANSAANNTANSEPGDERYHALDAAFAKTLALYRDWVSYAGSDALLVKILNESTINNDMAAVVGQFSSLADAFVAHQIATAALVRDDAAKLTQQLLIGFFAGGSLLLLLSLLAIRAIA